METITDFNLKKFKAVYSIFESIYGISNCIKSHLQEIIHKLLTTNSFYINGYKHFNKFNIENDCTSHKSQKIKIKYLWVQKK